MTSKANGNADGADQNKEDDGVLTMALGNNLVPFFVQGLLDARAGGLINPPLNAGTSFGGSSPCTPGVAHN